MRIYWVPSDSLLLMYSTVLCSYYVYGRVPYCTVGYYTEESTQCYRFFSE
jgi:hypothetical protein